MLDTELVAVDRNSGNHLRSFQELATRARGAITTQQARRFATLQHAALASDCCVDTAYLFKALTSAVPGVRAPACGR